MVGPRSEACTKHRLYANLHGVGVPQRNGNGDGDEVVLDGDNGWE